MYNKAPQYLVTSNNDLFAYTSVVSHFRKVQLGWLVFMLCHV